MDPVEDTYPRKSSCPACGTRHPVHADGPHAGTIVEHSVTHHQISDDQQYSCTVTVTCTGSFAKVSKWKRIK